MVEMKLRVFAKALEGWGMFGVLRGHVVDWTGM